MFSFSLCVSVCMEKRPCETQGESGCLQKESTARTLILDFQSLELQEIKFLLFKPPISIFGYDSLSRLINQPLALLSFYHSSTSTALGMLVHSTHSGHSIHVCHLISDRCFICNGTP